MVNNQDQHNEFQERKQKEFYDKYPLCFPKGEPYCGFYCGYGWWPVLDRLCADITKVLESTPDSEFAVAQIKEKFGGLRFYVDGTGNSREVIYTLINKAEKECWDICEDCGGPGKRQTGGWVKTRCDACQKKFEEKRARGEW